MAKGKEMPPLVAGRIMLSSTRDKDSADKTKHLLGCWKEVFLYEAKKINLFFIFFS